MMTAGRTFAMALTLLFAVPGIAHAAPADVAAALAAPGRTPDNIKLDVGRKPAELLRYLGLRRGMQVADMFGGNRYWAEIFASAVGPRGRVTVWVPTQFNSDKIKAATADLVASRPNVRIISSPFETPNVAPRAFDFMLINLDYHDVYWENTRRGIPRMEPETWLKPIFASIKPGGIVGVVDNSGKPGDTRAIVDALHRIDPQIVKADFLRAGFVLDGESQLLRNPADDLSLLVFDPAIRGKQDRFIYRFRKPR